MEPFASWQAFRGTLSGVVTLVDHLYYLHFAFGNAIISNNIEILPVGTPVRELLTPAGFRTAAINLLAASTLEPDRQMVHRSTGLTLNGMKAVYTEAKKSTGLKAFAAILNPNYTMPVKFTKSGMLPIVEGALPTSPPLHRVSGRLCCAAACF